MLQNQVSQIQYLFQPVSEHLQNNLAQLYLEASCYLYQRLKIDIQTSQSTQQQYPQNRSILIQLRHNYIIQVDPHTNKFLSYFECNLDVTFKIIRNEPADVQQLGDLIGIQFRSQKFKKKNTFLYLHQEDKKKQSQNLLRFCEILGKKFIMQDGFHQLYRAIKKIGKGVTASVYKALRLSDRKQVAVKSFKKQQYYQVDNGRGKMAFQKQFKAMTQVDSKYLCRLISVYESQNSIYIVMQILTRSLYSYLKLNGFPGLELAKQLMVKLLLGLRQMHINNIMHRDLKLQNIMILQNGIKIQPIIIDFGLAQNPSNSQFLYIKCGTPGYIAPQVLNLKSNMIPSPPYSSKCDIFSMGVIFFILLAGKTVFEGNQQRQVVKKNRQCIIDYNFPNQHKLNDQMKFLLKNMLQKQPHQRLSVDQLLDLDFFKEVQILKQFKPAKTGIQIEIEDKQTMD